MAPINLNEPNFLCREQRLGAITGYEGTAADLAERSQRRALCNRRRTFTQCGTCASQTAICQVSMIQDAAVVNHAPLGCAGDFVGFNLVNRNGRIKRGLPPANAQIISSNLTEREAVFGGTAKLEEAIRTAYGRFHPKAIFVTASCASAITGEDVDGAAEKLEREFDIPIAAVHCEGFRSQVWATGFDAAYHAILRKIVKPPKTRRPDVVNVVTFWGNDVFSELFCPMGLKANPVVPFATVEKLQQLSESAATVQMCPTLGTYLGAGLESEYGVPEVKAPPPYGIAGVDAWLRELARVTGKTAEVESVIASEKDRIASELARLREEIKGLRVCVAAGSIHGHSIACVLRELGAEVVGSYFWHHDLTLDNSDRSGESLRHLVTHHGDINVTICNKQAYELVNYLRTLRPDLMVIRHAGLAVAIAKLGIPTFLIEDEHFGLGYRGIVRYGRKIVDALANQSFVQHLAQHTRLPYTPWWLEQSPHAFLSDNHE